MRAFQQDDAFRSLHVVDAALSADGQFAVCQIAETARGKTKDEDKQANSLWRVDVAGGEPKRLTAKGGNASSPVLTPDGKTVLFSSARDPEGKIAQIYALPLAGGEAEAVTSLEQGVLEFALSPDGKWLAFAAVEKVSGVPNPNAHTRIDRLPFRLDAFPGYLQDSPQAVYVMPAAGGEPKALTPYDGLVSELAWSPDSKEIAAAFIAKSSEKSTPMAAEICIIQRDGGAKPLLAGVGAQALFWTADGTKIGYLGLRDGNLAHQSQLWLIDRKDGSVTCRTQRLDRVVGAGLQTHNATWNSPLRALLTADGQHVIAPVTSGGEMAPYKIALSGAESAEPIVKGPRSVLPLALSGSTLVCAVQDCVTPSELWAVDLKTGKDRAVTKFNAAWQSEIAWPSLERVVVKSGGGVDIEGWVLKPQNAKPPYKTLLYIHGGPHYGFGNTYNEDFQEFVGAGYALAFANPRGSTGYGDAFSTCIAGCWGNPEFEDFNAFLDELVARGISDPDKLGVTGVSGGGHLSAWLIGHTDRFKAAIPEQGVYNMLSFYGVSDIGISLATVEMVGHPHEQGGMQRYWELSPIAHLHNCKTPTLLIQGENDIRCPMEQAEQAFTVLKHNGCEVEFLRLKDCYHALEIMGPPPLRRFRMDAMKDWFDRHI